MARFSIGIDIGTTNSAVAYLDRTQSNREIRLFPVAQLVAPGEVEQRETLPSFHYEAQKGEFPEGSLERGSLALERAPTNCIIGVLAKEQGGKNPERLIRSAKSWMSHTGVDRTAALLPWHGPADVTRLSPAEVNARYVAHIRDAWNDEFPEHPLHEQDIILTVPASYDEVARELTVEAARKAGLHDVVLLEEPQAALYSWLAAHKQDWQEHLRAGETILVCDIGGGTTDFTLIQVEMEADEQLRLKRIRVGEHLILGGDNLDLALAHHIENELSSKTQLDVRQWGVLVQKCQSAKETLLSPDSPEEIGISLPTSGRKLFRRAVHVTISKETIQKVLFEGFLPLVAINERPEHRKSGFQEFGLNYASDPAMSKHLAAFLDLERNLECGHPARILRADRDVRAPKYILFNGGFFQASAFIERMTTLFESWFPEHPPRVLEHQDLNLAVAYGAAYYGLVKQGEGVRISSGLARSYYIGFEGGDTAQAQAMCLIPAGLMEGEQVDLTARHFTLRIRQPVEFPLFMSQNRPKDTPGKIVTIHTEDLTPLPPIRTLLPAGKKTKRREVTVTLHAKLTEIGTLDLWCSETQGDRSWKLQFDTRAVPQMNDGSPGEEGVPVSIENDILEQALELLQRTFGQQASDSPDPDKMYTRIEKLSGMKRRKWPLSFLRALWETLFQLEACRHYHATYEARWLNMLGFCLRPGYGMNIDDWRVHQTWTLLTQKEVINKRNQLCQAEWWIVWRRISGGLLKTHQNALLERCLPLMTDTKGRISKKSRIGNHEFAEICRVAGSLEVVDMPSKIHLGDMVVEALERKSTKPEHEPYFWTLGRIGGRVPVYGPLDCVVSAEVVETWLERVLALPQTERQQMFPFMQLARKTGDRYRDISDELRERIVERLHNADAPQHYCKLVEEGGHLDEEEQRLIFGESLPVGLKIL